MAVYTRTHDAQDALKAALAALPALATFSVDLGYPSRVLDEHVWVSGDLDESEQRYLVSGLTAKEEEFRLRVLVVVTAKDDEYVTPRDRVRDATRAIETMVNTNYTLDGTVSLAEVERHLLDEAIPDETTRQVMATLFIKCQAWQA